MGPRDNLRINDILDIVRFISKYLVELTVRMILSQAYVSLSELSKSLSLRYFQIILLFVR